MAFEVGSDIEGMCSSCGDVWHVIVAKVGPKVTKVQCKQCGKQHRLKPTGDAPEANLNPTRKKVATKTSSAKRGASKSARGRGADEPAFSWDPSAPVRAYSMRERFAAGEQLRHKKFGEGIVVALEEGKIRVRFKAETKVLLHDRS